MIRPTTLGLISLLSITNALPAPFFSPDLSLSTYSSLLTAFTQPLDLTNCPLDTTTLPSSTLTPPGEDLALKYLVLGRGTQNYTCADQTDNSTPKAIGATATLFDASCLAALTSNSNSDSNPINHEDATKPQTRSKSLLALLPDILQPIPLSNLELSTSILARITGQNLLIGKHYFTAEGVPLFDLRDGQQSSSSDSWMKAEKEGAMDAPVKPGYGLTGDVDWLKLVGVEGGLEVSLSLCRVLTAFALALHVE